MRAQVYNTSVPWPSLKPRCSALSLGKAGRLSLGDVTAHCRFQVSLSRTHIVPWVPGGMLCNKVLHGEAPHQGQATYPFISDLQILYPFRIYPFHIPSLERASLLTVNALSLNMNRSTFHSHNINLPVLLGHSFCGFFKFKNPHLDLRKRHPKSITSNSRSQWNLLKILRHKQLAGLATSWN